MTNSPQASFARLRDRIEESDEMTEDDREVLQDFDQQLSLLKTVLCRIARQRGIRRQIG